ncbi:MAG: chromate resistance protein [Gemmatimonadota bacterium]|nr:chromate resistance protein [Gemmatimonadota bacterium]
MNDTARLDAQEVSREATWLLLIHQLPPKPDYLRVKVRRRLKGVGAAPLKNTVYALPNTDEALEDFSWIVREIESEGGSAMLCEATFLEGISDEEVGAMLSAESSDVGDETNPGSVDRVEPNRTWVTREGVFVDRMASAWLIRRFIDPAAKFKFVPSRGYSPKTGELRFDMFNAEYTHEGERCTFQTLVNRFGLGDRALRAIGEIIHDIDCKDEQFGRPETRGVMRLLRGIADSTTSDAERIERGGVLFDDLYASFKNAR